MGWPMKLGGVPLERVSPVAMFGAADAAGAPDDGAADDAARLQDDGAADDAAGRVDAPGSPDAGAVDAGVVAAGASDGPGGPALVGADDAARVGVAAPITSAAARSSDLAAGRAVSRAARTRPATHTRGRIRLCPSRPARPCRTASVPCRTASIPGSRAARRRGMNSSAITSADAITADGAARPWRTPGRQAHAATARCPAARCPAARCSAARYTSAPPGATLESRTVPERRTRKGPEEPPRTHVGVDVIAAVSDRS